MAGRPNRVAVSGRSRPARTTEPMLRTAGATPNVRQGCSRGVTRAPPEQFGQAAWPLGRAPFRNAVIRGASDPAGASPAGSLSAHQGPTPRAQKTPPLHLSGSDPCGSAPRGRHRLGDLCTFAGQAPELGSRNTPTPGSVLQGSTNCTKGCEVHFAPCTALSHNKRPGCPSVRHQRAENTFQAPVLPLGSAVPARQSLSPPAQPAVGCP